MANQIKVAMVNSIHTLRQQGWSFRKIAQALGIHRDTVARHVRLAESSPKPATNPTVGTAGPASLCEPWRDTIQRKLDAGLCAVRIWQDLVGDHGFGGSYSSVKRFVRRLGRASDLPFRRMECAPAHEAQVRPPPATPRQLRAAIGSERVDQAPLSVADLTLQKDVRGLTRCANLHEPQPRLALGLATMNELDPREIVEVSLATRHQKPRGDRGR